VPKRSRRLTSPKPEPEPAPVSETPPAHADELLPGGPAVELPEPAADPARDVPEV
jgi:hypothetical protein